MSGQVAKGLHKSEKGVKQVEKESYSIDDILSEVKSRREKQHEGDGFAIKEVSTDSNSDKDTPSENITDNSDSSENEISAQDSATEEFSITEEEPVHQEVLTEEPVLEINEPEPQPEPEVTIEIDPDDAKQTVDDEPQADENEQTADDEPEEKTKKTDEPQSSEKAADDGYVDLLAMADEIPDTIISTEPDEEKPKQRVSFFKTKKGRLVRNVIIVLLILIVVLGIGAGIYIKNSVDNMTENKPAEYDQEWRGMSQLIENFPEIEEDGADSLSSYQDMIRTWYYNGAPCSSTHVLNVLLIGEDTHDEEILDSETRADSAIIVSVNIDTKEITLTSVLRDTYSYWENTPGDSETGEFGKINGAMLGGISNYINCVERMYKIDIDNYVLVNFDSFMGMIDELGGVDLELTSAEINEINNNDERYGWVYIEKTFEGNSGVVHLTGEQALAYCRIRYIDSDNKRAERQKTCLMTIFDDIRTRSSVTQLKVVNALLPYVKTGFSSSEILSIARYALSQGWLDFDIRTVNVPFARINERGMGGEYYGAWCWKADYPQDANMLQTLLYGHSPITLAEKRVDVVHCNLYGFYAETLVPCYSVITNNSYREVTTYDSFFVEDEEEATNQ